MSKELFYDVELKFKAKPKTGKNRQLIDLFIFHQAVVKGIFPVIYIRNADISFQSGVLSEEKCLFQIQVETMVRRKPIRIRFPVQHSDDAVLSNIILVHSIKNNLFK